jgi:hypothetical protein
MILTANYLDGLVRLGYGVRIYDSPSSSTYVALTCDAQGRATLDDVLYSSSGLVTRQNAGAVSDSGNHNINGALAVDSSNGRIYFRYGGGWHYVNQTAGFEVPAHERICPVC